VRKPRAEWKNLDDLAAHFAEFDLRCTAGDYDTAVRLLTDIDFDFLLLWGHYRLMIAFHEKLLGKVSNKNLASLSAGNLGIALQAVGQIHQSIKYFLKTLEAARENKNVQAEGASLGNLGYSYLSLGEIQKAIECFEKALSIARKIHDKGDEGDALSALGTAYARLGKLHRAIEYHERSLGIAQETNDRDGEASNLNNLGIWHTQLGEPRKAIQFHERALLIARERSDRQGELIYVENIGYTFSILEEFHKAVELIKQAIQFADEISFQRMQKFGRWRLSQVYLFQNDINAALKAIEDSLQYDVAEYNHDSTALLGIIVLRQGRIQSAQEAFMKSIAQADEILARTPDYYSALDAKGLALCGLAICDGKQHIATAIETFRRARKIAPHAGVVKSVLRLFDELVKCDVEGVLAGVRKAAEGAED
jgi:tetratricopeptide (TPR) repeat protein